MVELKEEILKRIRKELENIAKDENRNPIPYGILAERAGLMKFSNWFYIIGEYLGEINKEEVRIHNRPLLSVLVVNDTEEYMPADGFFDFAIEMGRWDGSGTKREFFEREFKEVRKAWSKSRGNIMSYKCRCPNTECSEICDVKLGETHKCHKCGTNFTVHEDDRK